MLSRLPDTRIQPSPFLCFVFNALRNDAFCLFRTRPTTKLRPCIGSRPLLDLARSD